MAISFGLIAFQTTGVNHFSEDGYITTISVIQLLAISWLALRIHLSPKKATASSLWLVIAFGFFFLAADELFQIHENLDVLIHQLLHLQETAVTDRIDDLLVGLYGVVGLVVLIAHPIAFGQYKQSFPYFILGFILFFTMVILDMLTNRDDILLMLLGEKWGQIGTTWLSLIEDGLKILAESFFISGFHQILRLIRDVRFALS